MMPLRCTTAGLFTVIVQYVSTGCVAGILTMLLMALGTRQDTGAGSSGDKPVACKAMPKPKKRVDTPGFHV